MKVIKPSSMWRGQNPHKEILSLHCIKLWRWSPGCSNSKIVEVLPSWNVCWGQLHAERNLAKRKAVRATGSRSESEGLHKLFVTQIILSWAPNSKMSLSYGCFPFPVRVWSDFSFLCCFPVPGCECSFCDIVCWKCVTYAWLQRGSWLGYCLEYPKTLCASEGWTILRLSKATRTFRGTLYEVYSLK